MRRREGLRRSLCILVFKKGEKEGLDEEVCGVLKIWSLSSVIRHKAWEALTRRSTLVDLDDLSACIR